MRNNIKKINTKLSKYQAYRQACLFCRALWRVARVIVPAILGAYLIYAYNDKVIIALGVAGLLYSLLVIVNSAYLAEASINKKRK